MIYKKFNKGNYHKFNRFYQYYLILKRIKLQSSNNKVGNRR